MVQLAQCSEQPLEEKRKETHEKGNLTLAFSRYSHRPHLQQCSPSSMQKHVVLSLDNPIAASLDSHTKTSPEKPLWLHRRRTRRGGADAAALLTFGHPLHRSASDPHPRTPASLHHLPWSSLIQHLHAWRLRQH
jgi:hypothetical protein